MSRPRSIKTETNCDRKGHKKKKKFSSASPTATYRFKREKKRKEKKEKHDVDISNPVKENVRLCIFLAAIRETLSCVDERFKVGESKGKKREENS